MRLLVVIVFVLHHELLVRRTPSVFQTWAIVRFFELGKSLADRFLDLHSNQLSILLEGALKLRSALLRLVVVNRKTILSTRERALAVQNSNIKINETDGAVFSESNITFKNVQVADITLNKNPGDALRLFLDAGRGQRLRDAEILVLRDAMKGVEVFVVDH